MNRVVLIYGPSGSGKTRLLKGISGVLSKRRSMKALHVDALDLCDNTVKAIASGSYDGYRASLAEYDALLIDNVWILSSRPRTAAKVLSALVDLARDGKLVVVASDIAPTGLASWIGHGDASKLFRLVPMSEDTLSLRPSFARLPA